MALAESNNTDTDIAQPVIFSSESVDLTVVTVPQNMSLRAASTFTDLLDTGLVTDVTFLNDSNNSLEPVPHILSKSLSWTRYLPLLEGQYKKSVGIKQVFGVLSHSGRIVLDDWVDSDAGSGSGSATSGSNTNEKASGELDSDWEDLDGNDLQHQFALSSKPDDVSKHSSNKAVAEGMELMQFNQLVVNLVNEGSRSSNEDMLVNSHKGIGSEVQNESDGVGVQLERSSLLKILKELVALPQQATLFSQDFAFSCSDAYVPEETEVNAKPFWSERVCT
ncbi:hypothetical protein ACQ4PT_052188 [Festuca glaucescens]